MKFKSDINGIKATQLQGFFVGWPNPPNPKTHLKILENSAYKVLAIDEKTNQVVGFVTAISDGVLSAYIPLLEVLPTHQKKGIGTELMQQMFVLLKDHYMIDLLCDEEMCSYYEALHMNKARGMIKRNYQHQSGRSEM